MNKQDTENVLNIVNVAYPQYLKHMTPIERKTQLSVWYDLLRNYAKEDVVVAVRKHIEINKYPPSIADIREKLKLMGRIKSARTTLADNAKLLTSTQRDSLTAYKSELAKIETEIAHLEDKSHENIRDLRLRQHELKCSIELLQEEESRLQRNAEKELEKAERAWRA